MVTNQQFKAKGQGIIYTPPWRSATVMIKCVCGGGAILNIKYLLLGLFLLIVIY